jgi:hypothetical protein
MRVTELLTESFLIMTIQIICSDIFCYRVQEDVLKGFDDFNEITNLDSGITFLFDLSRKGWDIGLPPFISFFSL